MSRAVSASPALPVIRVQLTRRAGAPAKPTSSEVSGVFSAALELVSVRRAAVLRAQKALSVNVIFIGDEEIAAANLQHMNHQGPTDVLSFPIGEPDLESGAFHVGDILASFDTARREAEARKLPLTEELLRYCVHGFLHCLGYDDATPAKRRAMFAVQEEALRAAFKPH